MAARELCPAWQLTLELRLGRNVGDHAAEAAI